MDITPHDLFIAAALQGLLAGRNQNATQYNTQEVARIAVECADYTLLAMAAPSTVVFDPEPEDPTVPVVTDEES